MKNLLKLIMLTLGLTCFSQTQAEMNQQAYNEFNKADQHLNDVYENILTKYKSDTIFVENLKKSQRLWIKFRDAELEMKYPNYPDQIKGSLHSTCRAFFLMELTKKRITTLQKWLQGTVEGDTCAGSVRINE